MEEIDELESEFNPQQLEDFKTPDLDPKAKERKKRLLKRIFILISIIILIIISIIIYKIVTKEKHYYIKSKFTTTEENEKIDIINKNVIEDIDVEIKINGKKKRKKYYFLYYRKTWNN